MKKIGIVGWNQGENSFGASKSYLTWLGQFGIVYILTPQSGIIEGLDLLVLPGGADLAPQAYNEVPGFYTGNTDVMKQFFYDNNLDQYIAAGVPVFGVCLGFQQLCAKFGGKLIQDNYYPSSTKYRGELVEEMFLNPESSAHQFLNSGVLPNRKVKPYEINSIHHQGCHIMPEGTEILGVSKYGNIEAIRFADNIFGTQYHPEEYNDELASNIVKYLLKL